MGYVHTIRLGDTYLPLGRTLKNGGTARDLTGESVQFKLVAKDGTVVVDWDTAEVVDAEAGQVQYDLASADVDEAGRYRYWFRVGDGSEWTTYPPTRSGELLIIH